MEQGRVPVLTTISGGDSYEGGKVSYRKDIKVAYLVQEPSYPAEQTVLEVCLSGDTPALSVVREYERAVESGDGGAITAAIDAMDRVGAWDYESTVKQILSRLKITDYNKPIGQLSGGMTQTCGVG